METLVDDQMVMAWPQSGELFRGHQNVLGALGYPDIFAAADAVPWAAVGTGEKTALVVDGFSCVMQLDQLSDIECTALVSLVRRALSC